VAIALELAQRGMTVDLIAGPIEIEVDHPGIRRVNVETALEMEAAAQSALLNRAPDVIIGTAAVADVRPTSPTSEKTAKTDLPSSISLTENPDILQGLNEAAPPSCYKVGFALAHDDGLEAALRKLEQKKCDLVVLNSLADKGAGFGHTTNQVRFVHGPNRIDSFDLKSKQEVAADLAEVIQSQLSERPTLS
jgi:phosphopantothenoylcysteine decarboxylase/phosphopantothenate--cysteine ligase